MSAQDTQGDWAGLGFVGKAALAFTGTFITIGVFAISAGLTVIEQAFAGTSNAAMMVQILAVMVAPVFAIASPFAGKLVTRYGVREVWLASTVLAVVSGLAPALCTELWQMLPFRVLIGCAAAGAFTAGMTGVAQVPERQRHMLYGLVSFFGGGIAILAYPVVGQLAARGWQFAFLVHLLLLPIGLLGLALPRHPKAEVLDAGQAAAAGKARVPAYLLYGAAVNGWAIVGSTFFAPFLLASVGVNDPGRLGSMLAIVSLCSLAGSGSYGFVHRLFGTGGMILLGLGAVVVGALVVTVAGSVPIAVGGIGTMGAGISIFTAAVYAAAGDAVVARGGTAAAAAGAVNFAVYLPQIAFPIIGKAISEAHGPAMVYLFLAVLLGIGVAMAVPPLLGAKRTPAMA